MTSSPAPFPITYDPATGCNVEIGERIIVTKTDGTEAETFCRGWNLRSDGVLVIKTNELDAPPSWSDKYPVDRVRRVVDAKDREIARLRDALNAALKQIGELK